MKLRNKLILSCAALAAVATTAVSTTFAWYTSNTTVTADKISGTSKSSDDATLLISKTGAVGSWGSKVSLDINATDLVPVEYDATNKAYHAWDKENNEPLSAAAATSAYIQFSLYFKSGSTDNLNVTLTDFNFVETTTTLPSKMVLSNDGLTQSSAGTTYTCNFFRALTYVEEIGASTEVASGSVAAWTDAATAQTTGRTAYDIEELKTNTDSLSSGNAHQYYNSVKGLYEITTDTALDNTKTYYTFNSTTGAYTAVASPAVADIATYYECTGLDMTKSNSETLVEYGDRAATLLGETGAGVLSGYSPILKVTYTIYLDGWDLYCFDACQGQSFSLDMEFTGAKKTS